ncbi:MAG: NAD-binding protein [Armatimonadota bacterium]
MQSASQAVHEFWIVLRGVWINLALYALSLLVAAGLLAACGCYPGETFGEHLVTAFYMTRIESVANAHHHPLITVLVFALPILSLFILGEGAFRVASLYLGRKQRSQEWERLMVSTLSNHTVLCGAGELGRALLLEMLQRDPEADLVVVDTKEDILQELGITSPNVRHIDGDMTSMQVLEAANVQHAATLILASGNDAYNLEAIYKALRLNPQLDVWARLYRRGVTEFMDMASLTNIHFFSPYQQAAEALADALKAGQRRA